METQTLGFAHFISQADGLGKTLFVVLLAMSLASWYFIATKAVSNLRRRRNSARFVEMFWNASSIEEVRNEISTHGADEPFSHLTSHAIFARDHHQRIGGGKLGEAGSLGEFLTRGMRKVIDEETARLENGLTLLATVGSTAPFVGLLGTVWGVYGALVSIGMSGAGTLDKVAGPVGEALIMTGLGLAVALPAVVAYNVFTRHNRLTLSGLDAFAHDLFAYLTTGAMNQNGRVVSLNQGVA
ncbi:MAG: biopolymer transporter ExbB [Candidatus Dactylopiibacterium carminicum]|uniref:Biopolymer transport protein ExbB n=1 Tax=Candidatus Dactylopiibacterium carminicum TaxID=857335 RepID=A0A272EYY4_9RHOO|nr:MotA/TolQ/ExbB proton channel family protein [Candidatus Dactylopiibacterium carminicum]KAF7600824.1 biopolymer transporter ExbB [Candidatus Dactylopiibacterium carminicum]PAS95323.1 MAG: biopolymer transporter ExbB [Candidatus Dactylopiibacterium carminicum]PAS98665.1 MAG: biopolymer transporter ExbB [Candidatus Dactylopiibacterium carminicum]PAT00830.1 MAG: biopolymer transporter ExbB [Candidatus Dactylopiibacterium carminicum]